MVGVGRSRKKNDVNVLNSLDIRLLDTSPLKSWPSICVSSIEISRCLQAFAMFYRRVKRWTKVTACLLFLMGCQMIAPYLIRLITFGNENVFSITPVT